MGNVSIDELGLMFVKVCFSNYWGNIYFWGFYILFLLIYSINMKEKHGFFIYYTFILFLTIFNPLLVSIYKIYPDIDIVYYRFIWLLPVNIVIGYSFANIIQHLRSFRKKVIYCLIICCTIMLTGTPIIQSVSDIKIPDNLYKVPDQLIFLCNYIHQYSDSSTPVVIFNRDYHMLVRQYDPSIILALDRDLILYREGNPSFSLDESSDSYQYEKAIMDVVFYEDISNADMFIDSVALFNADFLVIPMKSTIHDFLLNTAGYKQIAVTEDYVLYQV